MHAVQPLQLNSRVSQVDGPQKTWLTDSVLPVQFLSPKKTANGEERSFWSWAVSEQVVLPVLPGRRANKRTFFSEPEKGDPTLSELPLRGIDPRSQCDPFQLTSTHGSTHVPLTLLTGLSLDRYSRLPHALNFDPKSLQISENNSEISVTKGARIRRVFRETQKDFAAQTLRSQLKIGPKQGQNHMGHGEYNIFDQTNHFTYRIQVREHHFRAVWPTQCPAHYLHLPKSEEN